MDKNINFDLAGAEEFKRAIARNPQKIIQLVGQFIIRGLSEYKKVILRSPWRIGMSGGGAPVQTGNLRDTHVTETSPFQGRIYPTAPYALSVSRGKGSMVARPWLNYAYTTADSDIQLLQGDLLKSIVADLAN